MLGAQLAKGQHGPQREQQVGQRPARMQSRANSGAEDIGMENIARPKNGKNLVGLGSFKSYVGLWFHQGALLADKHQVLVNAQQGRTRAISAMRSETPRKRLAWRRYCR